MKTVKQVSKQTGISVRTLHYYDEIGLLKPTTVTEAGYRLYDDKALEILQQILFFREFDLPLKEIKAILETPELDRNQILQSQRRMLVWKKERLERLISSIDDLLKGENRMNFEVFSKTELEEMYRAIVANMTSEQKAQISEQYGGMEEYEKHFISEASSPQAQKNYAKVVEWYGDKESVLDSVKNRAGSAEVVPAYIKRLNRIMEKLAAKKGMDVHSFEVKEIVGEYDFVSKQIYQMKDLTAMMLDMAKEYQNNTQLIAAQDAIFGEGTTVYIGQALEAFYAV